MAVNSNSNTPTRFRLALSALCLFALLLVSVPCAYCAPQTMRQTAQQAASVHVTMAAPQCDDCCPTTQVMSATKPCCAVQTPAVVTAVQALDAAPAGDFVPHYQPFTLVTVRDGVTARCAVHPPLLKTNLRI